jgi:IS605 OrfB family transposase
MVGTAPTGPSIITAVKTAVFKLHNPSCRKRAMLDFALLHNHLAYTKALKAITPVIKQLVDEELQCRLAEKDFPARERNKLTRERKWKRHALIGERINKVLVPLPLPSSAKASRSITGDIIGQIESHLELHGEQDSVGLPTVQPLRRDAVSYESALQALVSSRTKEEEDSARDDIVRSANAGQLRPMLFAKNRVDAGFLLLRKEEDNRYFIFLNLIPETSRFARLTKSEQRDGSCRRIQNLTNMRTGEVVSFRSKTGCLFPIEFGRDYQDADFLRSGSPLSAKLIKRNNRYEVHIAFEFKAPRIEPKTMMGVDRGIYNLASLAVVDSDGSIIDRKNIDGRQLRLVQRTMERRQRNLQKRGKPFTGRTKIHAADEAVHTAANAIVKLAVEHRSQIIMENLSPMTSRRGKRVRSNFNRVLNRSQYQKLQKVLGYKLAVAGLSRAREVHPGYTSQACPVCGHISRDNRAKLPMADGFRMHEFKCVACGFADDADLNASRNIALKWLWRDSLSPALRKTTFKEVPENKNFSAFLKFHAERRGECAYDRKVGSSGHTGLDAQYEDGEVAPSGIGNESAVQPRSGSNIPAGKNSPTMQSVVSPSDGIPLLPLTRTNSFPDG